MPILKADQTAAERLLKAAVRRAVEMIREESKHSAAAYAAVDHWCTTQARVAAMLGIAAQSADLLLADDERPAKKAAKRAPRKAGS